MLQLYHVVAREYCHANGGHAVVFSTKSRSLNTNFWESELKKRVLVQDPDSGEDCEKFSRMNHEVIKLQLLELFFLR